MLIEIDEYEAVNLREGLLFLRSVGGDTGDWLGQLLNKLGPPLDSRSLAPNKPLSTQQGELARRVGWKMLFS